MGNRLLITLFVFVTLVCVSNGLQLQTSRITLKQLQIFCSSAAAAVAVVGFSSTIPQVAHAEVPILTSNDVLKADVAGRIAVLRDINFAFKLYPEYINSKDYESFRGALRQPPSMDLRRTCLKLKPFLAEEKKKEFEDVYSVMIDAVNDMDVTAFKRMQGEDVPPKDVADKKLLLLLETATKNLEKLVELASR